MRYSAYHARRHAVLGFWHWFDAVRGLKTAESRIRNFRLMEEKLLGQLESVQQELQVQRGIQLEGKSNVAS